MTKMNQISVSFSFLLARAAAVTATISGKWLQSSYSTRIMQLLTSFSQKEEQGLAVQKLHRAMATQGCLNSMH